MMGALRDLEVTQQVGLLFAMLFGALLLASLIYLIRTLRERSVEQLDQDERFKRDLRAVWFGASVFWVGWVAGQVVATLLFALLSFLTLREYITLMHTTRADHRSLLFAFFVALPVQFVLAGSQFLDLFTVFVPVFVFLAIPVMSALGNDPVRFLERTAKIQWGVVVCVYGMSHAPALLLLDLPGYEGRGAFLAFYLVIVVAAAQLVQGAATRRLRRRPVARAISRSFSWYAWTAGVVAAACVGAALCWVTPFKLLPALVLGLVVSASGTLGQFVMKALKRDAGVRSWGAKASITGAVGLLDRVAPLCFAAPVFFHAVRWYFGV